MREIEEIVIAMVALVFACMIALSGYPLFAGFNLAARFVILLFAIGVGFIGHELAHKLAAEKFGGAARFVMWPPGILLMLILSTFGFIFAAIGAVYIFKPYITRRENGLISLAGPVTNLLFCVVFLIITISFNVAGISMTPIVASIVSLGFRINAFLAFFNLLPFAILDGAKIFHWNSSIWLATFIVALVMLFL